MVLDGVVRISNQHVNLGLPPWPLLDYVFYDDLRGLPALIDLIEYVYLTLDYLHRIEGMG